jgi:tetratricopeptide (TPR) repeat protein
MDEGLLIAHGGGWAGFNTFNIVDLENNNAVVQLCNRSGIRRGELVFRIYDILHGKKVEIPKMPVGEYLLRESQTQNIEAIVDLYHVLKEEHFDEYQFGEGELNLLGYRMIGQGRIGDAIKVFKLNISEYPESWNVYDSMGEAYMLNREFDKSRENYQKSLELNPDNNNAAEKLKELGSVD